MTAESPPTGNPPRPVVFLPCHSLDDFPTWLDERESDDLLAAWTTPWDPRIIAIGGTPRWASIDLPAPAGPILGIVPASWDDRFAAQFDAAADAEARLVRGVRGRAPLAAAALAEAGIDPAASGVERWIDEFRALGLAVLLAELLARRMRSEAALETTGFDAALATAAAAAVAGRDDDARTGLQDCYRCLEAARARYYPVDAWLVDLVLVAPGTTGAHLRDDLAAPVPIGVVADGRAIAGLAARDPAAVAELGRAITEGHAAACGGPLDDGPLDARVPEQLIAAFSAGAAAWHDAVGGRPAIFARHGGGGSACLPQLLAGLGIEGALWNTFDGTPLPDPGAGRILWEGTGAATVEALARPPLDARAASGVLALPERLGDAMDHDHVAVLTFAHHAGTAGEWHRLLRRIGGRSTALGTFVAPDEFLRRTAGGGTVTAFGPDAFPPTPPPETEGGDPVAAAIAAAREAAVGIVRRAGEFEGLVVAGAAAAVEGLEAHAPRGIARALAGWWPGPRRDDPGLVLSDDAIRVEVHPETGGILSLRRPGAGPNRLSQQLAPRSAVGHGRMRVEAIDRTGSGVAAGIVTRGRLLDATGRETGRFVQELALVPGLPLVAVDLVVTMPGTAADAGPLARDHVACRFAWHENEDVEIRRSVHLQSVVTERTRFTAPHFIEIAPAGLRGGPADAVTILCGGLPWHVRSSPHVLDTILGPPAGELRRRLALGIGLERPWDAALELLAGVTPGTGPRPGPATVRVAVLDPPAGEGRLRLGLFESAGITGRVRLEWARPVAAAARELDGRPRPGTDVAIEGGAVIVMLRAHEWLAVDLEFGA